MLATVPAVPAVPDLPAVPTTTGLAHRAARSLADCDEYGPITGRPGGLFTATAPLALDARDELGRPIAAWVPDRDLL